MKISIINASPKEKESASKLILNYLIARLSPVAQVETYHINGRKAIDTIIPQIFNADAVVIAIPLYMDSLPSHLLEPLVEMERYTKNNNLVHKPVVYVIVNGGFYEGRNSLIAINMMKHWCKKAQLPWGQALGIGGGDMYSGLSGLPIGKGPSRNLGNALDKMAETINELGVEETMLSSPNIPRLAWRMGASILVWNKRGKANGLSKQDLKQKNTG